MPHVQHSTERNLRTEIFQIKTLEKNLICTKVTILKTLRNQRPIKVSLFQASTQLKSKT